VAATEATKGSRGSDPRLLGLTMGWLLDRTFGGRPRGIKDRQCPRVRPTLIILQQDRQLKRLDPYGLGAPFEFEPDGGNGWAEVLLAAIWLNLTGQPIQRVGWGP
jgi:hypothetical protein